MSVRGGQHVRQQLWIHVTSTNYGDGFLRFGQFLRMEEPGRERHRSAGLADDASIHGHTTHGATDLGFADRYDVVDVLADVLEVDGSDRLRAQTVSQCAGDTFGRQLDNLTFAETLLRVV